MRRPKISLLAVVVLLALCLAQPIGSFPINTFSDIEPNNVRPTKDFSRSELPIGYVRLEEHGVSTYLGDDSWSYRTSIGESNTWDGSDYVRYIYDLDNKRVQIGKLIFTHGLNGVISINHTGHGSMIGELKWYAQYYFNDAWQNFTFDNYEFLGAVKTDDNATVNQRWWSTNGELNVSYTYTYWNELKMRAKATNWAAQSVPVRVLWALTDISITPDYTLLYDNEIAVGVALGNEQQIFWHDVTQSTPEININPILDKPNRRAAVVFGNMSSVLSQDETMDIDPTYTVAADSDDDSWQLTTATHLTTSEQVYVYNSSGEVIEYIGQFRYSLSIPRSSTINSADFYAYEELDGTIRTFYVRRIDEENVGSLEGDTVRPIWNNDTIDTYVSDATGYEWASCDVTSLVQAQVNLEYWCTDNYIGLVFNINNEPSGDHRFEDYQSTYTNHSYLEIDYTEGSVNQYQVAIDHDDDYWRINHTDSVWTHYTSSSGISVTNQSGLPSNISYLARWRVSIDRPYQTVVAWAKLKLFEYTSASVRTLSIRRINEVNVGDLEEDTEFSQLANDTWGEWDYLGLSYTWHNATVTDLVQEQLNLVGWQTDYYIGFVMSQPEAATGVPNFADSNLYYAEYRGFLEIEWGEDEYNYVDNNDSDKDSSSDIGTHSSFSDEQSAPDSAYDILTEANFGGGFWGWTDDYFDQENTDIDSNADVGTQTNPLYANDSINSQYMNLLEYNQGSEPTDYNDWFTNYDTNIDGVVDVGTETTPENAQDLGDADYMTLQEANQGGAGVDEYRYIDTYTENGWTEVGANPYLNAQDQPTNYIHSTTNAEQTNWNGFAATSGTGTGFTVVFEVYHASTTDSYIEWELDWTGDSTADASGTFATGHAWAWEADAVDLSALDTQTEIDACTMRLTLNKGGGGPDLIEIDAARLYIVQSASSDYELNFEYQWTSANYSETSEEVCFNVLAYQQTASETLKAWEWSVDAWYLLGTFTTDGWNNFTPSYLTDSIYYIKLNDTLQSAESDQDTWSIDSIILHTWSAAVYDYEIDFEYQWTSAAYEEGNGNVSIYVPAGNPSENMTVWEWDGASAWVSLGEIDNTAGWHNFTCTELDSATYYINIRDDNQASDTTQDDWDIDLITLATWNTTNLRLDLEVQWTTANYELDNEYICIYTGATDAEDLEVWIWDEVASQWDSLFTDLTASGWNNISVSEEEGWAEQATITLRFLDDNQTNDGTSQDAWQIDSVVFRSYSAPVTYKYLYESISIDETDTRVADISYVLYESISIAETIINAASIIIKMFESLGLAVSMSASKMIQKFFFESVGLTESMTLVFAASRIFFESVTVNETPIFTLDMSRTLFESVTISEQEHFTLDASRVLTESFSVNETDTLQQIISKLMFESVGISVTANFTLEASIGLSESIAINVTTNTNFNGVKNLSESISVNETINTGQSQYLELFESITINDTWTREIDIALPLSESITINETYLGSASIFVDFSESISIDEIVNRNVEIVINLTESMTIDDTAFPFLIIQKVLFESIIINEIDTRILTAILALEEGITISSDLNTTLTAVASFSESITINEIVEPLIVIQKILYESVTINETNFTIFDAALSLNESITINEAFYDTETYLIVLNETISIDEIINNSAGIVVNLNESLIIDEVVEAFIVIQKILFESVTINETDTSVLSASIIMFESVTINETQNTVINIIRTLFESVTINETSILTPTYPTGVELNLFESIGIDEVVNTIIGRFILLPESITINESINTSLIVGLSLSESVSINEIISFVLGRSITLFESITVNETVNSLFTGQWLLNFSESINFGENDVWAPYRPIVTPPGGPGPGVPPITNKPGSTEWYLSILLAPIILFSLSAAGIMYVANIKPKRLKGSRELRIKGVGELTRTGRNTKRKTRVKKKKKSQNSKVRERKVKRKVPVKKE